MATGLQVGFTDFQCYRNNLQHQTAEMSTKHLVVRQGQPFTITLHFHGRGYQPGVDTILLIVETGPNAEKSSGTRAVFPVARSGPTSSWRAVCARTSPSCVEITLSAPANAVIGRYLLKARVDSGTGQATSYQLGEFTLLFNAWSPADDVYLASETARQEYVVNDYGFIYQGNKNWIHPCPWNYSQVEEGVVDICLRLLDRSLNFQHDPVEDCSLRNSPVYVSRVVSAMINSNDDSGVLLGNWSEDYSGGICPSEWTGSVAILRQWDATGAQPVKYGQCWVFAAVMCTVMRCLGVPTRVVTNTESGHEKDGNLVIDEYYNTMGHILATESKDSIWKFHVWNECWMARRDLSPGYAGWQVLDATPQETSNGLYCCGPASVKAIKEGELHLSYDTPFVFSMVNVYRVVWLIYGARKEKLLCDSRCVGNHISTKSIGRDERKDITDSYKYREGSQEERQVFAKALARAQHRKAQGPSTAEPQASRFLPGLRASLDVSSPAECRGQEAPSKVHTCLRLKLAKSPEVGQDLGLVLLAENLAFEHKDLKLSISTGSVLHDGAPLPPFWQNTLYIPFRPKEEKVIPWTISYAQYGRHLSQDRLVRVSVVGEENSTWEKLLVERIITLAYHAILINVLSPIAANRPFALEVEITNPLHEPARDCVLTMEGSGLLKEQFRLDMGVLRAQERSNITFQIIPFKTGQRQLQVNFKSNKVKDIKGHTTLIVAPNIRF
ncbi:protein-glutamine gamma-glutamyltransferase 5-like [Alligator sinensis]|uniref:protein-glutamine gamma-glutamyltransferase n=1 Tax=Alligator sinensis TaxID=38654 RepID=A0A3Q0FNM6_ALLSI|nr:protein-glutamine gamma-glutamyltransferase 5-like [Alligator sinensis]